MPEYGGLEDVILTPCRAALRTGSADERTTALLALMRATGLHRWWFRGIAPDDLELRIQHLTDGTWYGRGVPDLTEVRDVASSPADGSR